MDVRTNRYAISNPRMDEIIDHFGIAPWAEIPTQFLNPTPKVILHCQQTRNKISLRNRLANVWALRRCWGARERGGDMMVKSCGPLVGRSTYDVHKALDF